MATLLEMGMIALLARLLMAKATETRKMMTHRYHSSLYSLGASDSTERTGSISAIGGMFSTSGVWLVLSRGESF